tara:strand:- start:102 stop:566 length:465 start_codon:yes stop_codon:yes gene_type:complete
MSKVEQKLKELHMQLPTPTKPVGVYLPFVKSGNLIFLSGHGPATIDGEKQYQGKLGESLTVEEGYDAARLVGLNLLATLKTAISNLDRVNQIVKVLGMVNSTPDFNQHPKVINGFSELMTNLYDDKGKHARSAVGLVNLPFDIPVEIEMIVEIN